MSVNIHTAGDLAEHESVQTSEHRPPPLPADAVKNDATTRRQRLEASANALRARLARTLESLDRRRHDVLNVKVQAKRHPLPLALAGASALFVVGGTALTVYRSSKPKKSELGMLAERVRAAVRAWKNPLRPAKPKEPSVASEVARGVVISVASYAISQLAQRALGKFFPALIKEEPPK